VLLQAGSRLEYHLKVFYKDFQKPLKGLERHLGVLQSGASAFKRPWKATNPKPYWTIPQNVFRSFSHGIPLKFFVVWLR